MLSSKIPVRNTKLAASSIPVRCNKITTLKNNQSQAKSSDQLSLPSEVKGLQGKVSSLKSFKVSEINVKKSNRLPNINIQDVEKIKPIKNKNLKTEVKQAKKVEPQPLKLSNKLSKPVHQRTLSSVNVCTKEAKSYNVKKSQVQPESLKCGSRPAKPVPVLSRNFSSGYACNKEPKSHNVKKSKFQAQPVSQKESKNQDVKSQNKSKPLKEKQNKNQEVKSQNKSKPLKEKQNTVVGKHLVTSGEAKQPKKVEDQVEKQAFSDFHQLVDRKPSDAHNLPSSMVSNKENLGTLTVGEVKQIAEKQKNKVKKKEGSREIQSVSQKPEINEDLKLSKNTESEGDQCIAIEKESNSSCSATSDNGVNDSEFKNSQFFRSLILSERELSPGIIKLCSEPKVSSSQLQALYKSPLKRFTSDYSSAEDFLEDLRRNSSNHQRRKGLPSVVPGMKSPAKKYLETFSSVNDFVEDLRRNSAKFIKRRETLQNSPYLIGNQSSVKKLRFEYSSATDFVEDLRRNSANFIKRRGKLHVSPFQNTPYARRWTCNVQSNLAKKFPVGREESTFQKHKIPENKFSLKKYQENFSSVNDIVEDLRIRRRETLQNSPRSILNPAYNDPENILNSQPSALKGSETSKKKEKLKKKVTFYISPTNSSELTPSSEKLESDNIPAIVITNSGQLSQNSTPEFELNVYRNKENSLVFEDSKQKSSDSTPEFNFEALKTIPSLFSDESKDNDKEETLSAFTLKFDVGAVECSIDNRSHDSIHNKILDGKNTFEENIYSASSCHKSFVGEPLSTAIVRPMKRLSISSNNNLNETGAFVVRTEESIITPHAFSFYSNSYLVNSISPPILADRPSILASYAPIRTPLVLKNMAQNSELSPVRQRLDFEEVKLERRESQICLQNIPTIQKMNDYLCDQECCMLSLLTPEETLVLNRNLLNPIASVLNNGDEMHFVPLNTSCDTDFTVEYQASI